MTKIIDADEESARLLASKKQTCAPVVNADGVQARKHEQSTKSDDKQSPIIVAKEKEE